MTASSFRSLLIGSALLAFAPACGTTVEREGGDPSGSPVDENDAGDADDASDPDADDEVDPIDAPAQPARSSMCPSTVFSGGAADAVAVTWNDESASLVLRDGSTVALALPTEAPPPDATPFLGVVVGEDSVVITHGWSTFDGTPTARTMRWFDRRGVMTDELVSYDGLWASYVGADGTTVFFRSNEISRGCVARLADGTMHDIDGLDVWGEPLASGWLRGFDNDAGRAALLHPTTQERRLLDATAYPAYVDDGFAYLEQGEATPILVHVTPDATTRTNLGALEGIPVDTLYLTAVPRSPWALLTDYETRRAWRIDWAAGTAELVDTPPPAGSELLEDNCGFFQPTLTSSGEIMAGLRTAGDGQAAVASISGGWEPLGYPVAQPGTFSITETNGTFVVTGGNANNTYCPILGWDEPASSEAISFDKVQLIRPSADVVHVLDDVDSWSLLPTWDGGCVTFTSGADAYTEITRTVVDLSEGAEPVVIEGDNFAWFR